MNGPLDWPVLLALLPANTWLRTSEVHVKVGLAGYAMEVAAVGTMLRGLAELGEIRHNGKVGRASLRWWKDG